MIYAENILLCITIPLLISLLFVQGSVRRFIAAFLVGMGVCLLSAYISGFLSMATMMGENDTAIYISPIVEELMKLLPVLFCLAVFDPSEQGLDFVAVAVGAGFATFENCCYILTSGAEKLVYTMIRGLSVGVMHIVSIFALAFWLAVAKRLGALTFPSVVGALSLSMIFHALYNLLVSAPGVSSVIGYLMPIATALVLALIYRKLGKKLETAKKT
ncbi:MAG: PrsW family intramembrane metalloprotease [Clostridia bacterium]|nr:PrsW family intramembrane metalloprotease [Clostridia bacterium]